MSIRIGILGYGNLGRGVECAVRQNEDLELAAVFTRRDPETVSILTNTAKVCRISEVETWKDKIDVMILCGGSATDLPAQTPAYVKHFNVIDSFDTHARIPEHFEKWMPLRRRAVISALSRWAGTRECSHRTACMRMRFFQKAEIIHFGEGCQSGAFGCHSPN